MVPSPRTKGWISYGRHMQQPESCCPSHRTSFTMLPNALQATSLPPRTNHSFTKCHIPSTSPAPLKSEACPSQRAEDSGRPAPQTAAGVAP